MPLQMRSPGRDVKERAAGAEGRPVRPENSLLNRAPLAGGLEHPNTGRDASETEAANGVADRESGDGRIFGKRAVFVCPW